MKSVSLQQMMIPTGLAPNVKPCCIWSQKNQQKKWLQKKVGEGVLSAHFDILIMNILCPL